MEITLRQQQILEILNGLHFASVSELAKSIYVSEATVRRDIGKLEMKGLVKSVYGGVVKAQYFNEPVPVHMREGKNSAEKEEIAVMAAALINDNDTVIFDASSTVRRICRHIKTRKNLTVITNNLRVCEELKDSDVSVYCTGGVLINRRECFLGHYAEDFIRDINATSLFFSSQGFLENGNIVDSAAEENSLKRVMLEHAENKYFLCDSSKIGKNYPFILCNISDVTKVISDVRIDI